MKRIFVSGVQNEFASARALLKRHLSKNPAYRRLFDSFVFELDLVAADRHADEFYLDELQRSDIYLGMIGYEYGSEDAEGVSPTEREFDEATRLGLPRLLFVRGRDAGRRHPKEAAFLSKVSSELVRARCDDDSSLLLEIYASLDSILLADGTYRILPFDAASVPSATLADIDEAKVAWFVERARIQRRADWPDNLSTPALFKHLKLFADDSQHLVAAAVLLFAKDPQRFFLSSEVKCVQWYGTERRKPMLSYQTYRGSLFEMADAATAFVLSRINLSVGTRDRGLEAPRNYELPESAVAEAIVNAIAHRDYASSGAVQIELFSNRLVIRNPGRLNPAITPDELFLEHSSFPNNPLLAEALYQAKYIERFGSGFTDLLASCASAGLPLPTLEQHHGELALTLWRPVPEPSQTRPDDTTSPQRNDNVPVNVSVNVPVNVPVKDKVLELVRQCPGINRRQLAKALEVDVKTIARAVNNLAGLLEHHGSPKTGGYHLVPSSSNLADLNSADKLPSREDFP